MMNYGTVVDTSSTIGNDNNNNNNNNNEDVVVDTKSNHSIDLFSSTLQQVQQQQQQVQQQQQESQQPYLNLRQQLEATIYQPIHSTTIHDDEHYYRTTEMKNSNNNNNNDITIYFRFIIHPIYLLCYNTYSSLGIFILHLISYETMISILLSVGLTIYLHYYVIEDVDSDNETSFQGNTMSWVLLTFAVITPIGANISMVYTRRENALLQICTLRSTFIQLYNSYTVWGWDYTSYNDNDNNTITNMTQNHINGRTKSKLNWLEFTDHALQEILYLCNDISRLLTLPNDTRGRHNMTQIGRNEAKQIHVIHVRLLQSIIIRMGHLSEICETLKHEGLPPNESNRIRQWERQCLDAIERLRIIKVYRTPQGLRSFGRLFSMILPPFYAPYYAQLANDVNSLGIAITFAIFTALALTSLFETINQMEDPFILSSILDGVHVQNDLVVEFKPLLLGLRSRYFPGCPPFQEKE